MRFQNKAMFAIEDAWNPDMSLPAQFMINAERQNPWAKHHSGVDFDDIAFAEFSIDARDHRVPRRIIAGGRQYLPNHLRRALDPNISADAPIGMTRQDDQKYRGEESRQGCD